MSARIVPIEAPVRGQRRPRRKADDHLRWIRTLPCCVCKWRVQVEAAHLRMSNYRLGKRESGKGEKPSDQWTVPLCKIHHEKQHAMGEVPFWDWAGLNPFVVALALFAMSGDDEAGLMIIHGARL